MDFTREPVIETIITPKEGFKLVVRNSKSIGQEEFFVDSIEIVSFGHALFYRCLEKPKQFLAPVTDYEVLEVRDTRVVLKHNTKSQEKGSIKINSSKEKEPSNKKTKGQSAKNQPTKSQPAKKQDSSDQEEKEKEQEKEESKEETSSLNETKKRERKRIRKRRNPKEESQEALEEKTVEDNADEQKDSQEESEAKKEISPPKLRATLLPPPPGLISDRVKELRSKEEEAEKVSQESKEEPFFFQEPEQESDITEVQGTVQKPEQTVQEKELEQVPPLVEKEEVQPVKEYSEKTDNKEELEKSLPEEKEPSSEQTDSEKSLDKDKSEE